MNGYNDSYGYEDEPKSSFGRKVRFFVGFFVLLVLVGIFAMIKTGVIAVFRIPSRSMEPTLQIGDYIFMDAQAVPELFDVIAFPDPKDPESPPLIKRVVGEGGDRIEIRSGLLYINGELQYNAKIRGNRINWHDTQVKVPNDSVFVLGDNRNESYDSLNFGPVPLDSIQGVLRMIYWPPGRWGKIESFYGDEAAGEEGDEE
jgi:signal peptidase I